MTLGVGRGINLNFTTLATLLSAARNHTGFVVRSLSDITGFHENKVKGHQSWARMMGLVHDIELTPLAHQFLERDPSLTLPLSRGICYVEIASNPSAEVAYHICRVLLPRIVANGGSTSNKEIIAMLVGDGVGTESNAAEQPQRDAQLFLASLHSVNAFGGLGLLHQVKPAHYTTGLSQLGVELLGYALWRSWPNGTAYMRISEVYRLVAPLLLPQIRFLDELTVLERRGLVVRVTSSGLDQVRLTEDCCVEEVLWPNK